ncbi:MAG TPA: hypothetical protein VH497_03470 [Vicinamibacterales bacterium]|jgi:hypothetical protein
MLSAYIDGLSGVTPFGGAGSCAEVGEAKRQAVNEWIRTGQA